MLNDEHAEEFDKCASEDAGYGLEGLEDEEDDEAPGAGPYETLAAHGPRTSAGAGGHPGECSPCTFYCFTRRGCNRGLECRFCHAGHQSKLQQRRESWKKQQREKRKAIRERVAAETVVRRGGNSAGGCGGALPPSAPVKAAAPEGGDPGGFLGAAKPGKKPERKFESSGKGGARGGAAGQAPERAMLAGRQPWLFCYSPDQHIITVGQDVEFMPQVTAPSSGFRLATPCPPGLSLDSATGAIHGKATTGHATSSIVVEMEMQGGGVLRATIDIEVKDFTRGGYVVGHLSEYEKGRFMLLLYTPEEDGEDHRAGMGATSAQLDGVLPMLGYAVDPMASVTYLGKMGMEKAMVQYQGTPRGPAARQCDKAATAGGGQQEARCDWW